MFCHLVARDLLQIPPVKEFDNQPAHVGLLANLAKNTVAQFFSGHNVRIHEHSGK